MNWRAPLLALVLLAPLPAAAAPDLPALEAEVERVRGLEFKRPVPAESKTLEEAGADVRELLKREMDVPSTAIREGFLKSLGLLPEDASLERLLSRLYGEQVRGLYDPHRKVFLVVTDGAESPVTQQTLPLLGLDLAALYTLHELEHALQDQHFELLDIDKATSGSFDRAMAAQALIEGDANLVMFDSAAQKLGADSDMVVQFLGQMGGGVPGMDSFPEYQGAPRFMREYLTMPYFSGLQFVASLRRAGGWEKVNTAFRQLPASTEQVLHPEKYLQGGDPPLRVDLSAMPDTFGDYRCLGSDTAGEFVARVWAEGGAGEVEGRAAAAGWGGDTYRVYTSPTGRFVVWATAWDTEADAVDFEQFAKSALAGREATSVERRDRNVLVTLDVPARLDEAVGETAWRMKVTAP